MCLGHVDVARRLIMAGADVNQVDKMDGWNVLIKAIHRGHEQLVHDLLLSGANPNLGAPDVGTPLHVAAGCGSVGMVSALLAKGAVIDTRFKNDTPLMKAAAAGHLAVVHTLLDAGAAVELRGGGGSVDHGAALGRAAKNGHIAVIKAILNRGAKVDAVDRFGNTALYIAAYRKKVGAMDALIEAGTKIEVENSNSSTLLNATARWCRWESMRVLLKHGANTNVRDDEGNSPLHSACYTKARGMDVAVDLLLRFGADENAVNQLKETPAAVLSKQGPLRVSLRAPPQELKRARLLLARAEEDRAWRRKGWLVMLRSRAAKAKTNSCSNDDGGGGVTSAGDERGKRAGSKVARTGQVEWDRAGVLGLGSSCVVGTGGEEENVRGLVVPLLLDMGIDGVFLGGLHVRMDASAGVARDV